MDAWSRVTFRVDLQSKGLELAQIAFARLGGVVSYEEYLLAQLTQLI
jgi:hypothetical protein